MSAEPDWASLRRKLQSLIEQVGEEIRTYPAPIPACDAQFNHLLELRRLLPQELERLEAAARNPVAGVEDFIRSSPAALNWPTSEHRRRQRARDALITSSKLL